MTFGSVVSFSTCSCGSMISAIGLFFTVYRHRGLASRPFTGGWSDRFGRAGNDHSRHGVMGGDDFLA